MDDATFEREILRVVFETDLVLERATIAHALGITLDQAETGLEKLLQRGVLELDSDSEGNLLYVYPRRPLPRPKSHFVADPRPHPSSALAPANELNVEAIATRAALAAQAAVRAVTTEPLYPPIQPEEIDPPSAWLRAAASLFPGAGQFIGQRLAAGGVWLVAVPVVYWVFWPIGVVTHAACAVHAAIEPKRPTSR